MFRRSLFSARLSVAVALAALAAGVGIWLLAPGERTDVAWVRRSYDAHYAWLGLGGDRVPTGGVAIVYLDADSFLGRGLAPASPWPRDLHAALLDRLTTAGARAVGFDVVFDAPGARPEADRALTEALRRNGRATLAAELSAASQRPSEAAWARTRRLALPWEPLRNAARGWGLGEVGIDEDFVARRLFPGTTYNGERVPSLTWSIATQLGLTNAVPDRADRPAWLRYYGPPFALPHVSYRQALEPGAVPDEFFRDRIVLVGARPMAGSLQERRDEFRSPFREWGARDVFTPGVEVHATQMLNLVRGDWLRRLAPATELALVVGWGVLVAGLVWLRPVPAAGVALVGAAMVAGMEAWSFRRAGVWFPWLILVGAQLPLAYGGGVLYHSIDWFRARRRYEAEKRAAEVRLREQAALIDKAHDAIVVQDLNGRFLYLNPSAERLYGWTLAELQAGAGQSALAGDPALAGARRETLERGEWQGELTQQHRSGHHVMVESRWTLIRDEAGQARSLLQINTDITRARQLELETLRMQRMEGIGTLAGGMAHDLNNVLAPILMGAQLLQRETRDEETRRLLRLMEENSRRGAEMVRQVLLFARGRDGEFQRLELRPLLREMEKLVHDTFPRGITVTAYVASDLWPVRGDATQLHQVLLNLCVNARDAMPGGGTLSIAADNATLSAEEVASMPGVAAGDYVSVLVSDTGGGIPAEVLPRIFEPFFTTKPAGQGTGLGLSTASRILKAHGGFISVRPGEAGGTTFEVLVPRLATPGPEASDEAAIPLVLGGGELVLLAEDEQALREVIRRGLEDHGYRVLAAADGAAALALWRREGREVAVVVTDTDMPLLDGAGLIAAVRREQPGLPCIMMSGQAVSAEDAALLHLAKPFELARLLRTLAQALGRRSAE